MVKQIVVVRVTCFMQKLQLIFPNKTEPVSFLKQKWYLYVEDLNAKFLPAGS